LIKQGSDVTIRNKSGKTPYDIAVDKKIPKVIDYFNEEKRKSYEKN